MAFTGRRGERGGGQGRGAPCSALGHKGLLSSSFHSPHLFSATILRLTWKESMMIRAWSPCSISAISNELSSVKPLLTSMNKIQQSWDTHRKKHLRGHKVLYFTTPSTSSKSPQCKPTFLKEQPCINWPAQSHILFMKIYAIFLRRPIWTFSSQNLHVLRLRTRSVSEGSNFSDGHHKLQLLYQPFSSGLPLVHLKPCELWCSDEASRLIECWYAPWQNMGELRANQ